MSDRCYYVYAHYRKSDGRIFYIGKGQGNRCTSMTRSEWWKRITKKHGWFHKILYEGLTDRCAISIEKMLIAVHKEKLCNMTNGGDGISGYKFSDQSKEKMRKGQLGRRHTDETKAKLRNHRLNQIFPEGCWKKAGEKAKRPIINSNGEIFCSLTEAAKQMSIKLNRKVDASGLGLAASGKIHHSFGLAWSYDITKVPEYKPKFRKNNPILCVETGVVFARQHDAVEWVKSFRGKAMASNICDAIKIGRPAYGYNWKYL